MKLGCHSSLYKMTGYALAVLVLTLCCLGPSTVRAGDRPWTEYRDLERLLCRVLGMRCDGTSRQDQRQTAPSRYVYLNGKVYTVDGHGWENNPRQAIVLEGSRIEYVGTDVMAKKLIDENSVVYDLHGASVLPGFHDIHMHPLEAMNPVGAACELPNDALPNTTAFSAAFDLCRDTRLGTDWLLGGGYDIAYMMDYILDDPATNSPKNLLDSYISDRPAAFISVSSHSIWVNSRGLQEAGITSQSPDTPGTVIMREPGSREPNGLIFENGAMQITAFAMDPSRNPGMLDITFNGLIKAVSELARYGITSVCDARMFWQIQHDKAWERACDSGKLTVRAVLDAWAYPEADDNTQIQQLKDMYTEGRKGCSLKTSQIKVYMDGIVQSTTAAMLHKYNLNLSLPVISKANIGLNYFNKARLVKYLKALQSFGNGKGYDFNIHAIGDRGIRDALDAIQEASDPALERTPRHRLTHVEILSDHDIPRFSDLNVIADFQLSGHHVLPAAKPGLYPYIGQARADQSFRVKEVYESGAVTTLSSDWDVNTLNPLVGLQHAVERGPGEAIPLAAAVEMYTTSPAWAMRQADTVGRLKKDYQADLIVLDTDIFTASPHDIGKTQVLQTVFKGEVIHEHGRVGDMITDVTYQYMTYK